MCYGASAAFGQTRFLSQRCHFQLFDGKTTFLLSSGVLFVCLPGLGLHVLVYVALEENGEFLHK